MTKIYREEIVLSSRTLMLLSRCSRKKLKLYFCNGRFYISDDLSAHSTDVHVTLRIHNSNNIPSIQLNERLNYGLRVSYQDFRIYFSLEFNFHRRAYHESVETSRNANVCTTTERFLKFVNATRGDLPHFFCKNRAGMFSFSQLFNLRPLSKIKCSTDIQRPDR